MKALSMIVTPMGENVGFGSGNGFVEEAVDVAGKGAAFSAAYVSLAKGAGADGALAAPAEVGPIAEAALAVDVCSGEGVIVILAPAHGDVGFLFHVAGLGGKVAFAGLATKAAGGCEFSHSLPPGIF
jgi:hypothetical protein